MTATRTIIVGAGHSGGRAAEALHEADPERDIILIGREAHPPYERPPLSKAVLTGAAGSRDSYLHPAEWYPEHGIELRLSTGVAAIDRAGRALLLEDGARLAFDTLLLTTGARARTLPVPGAAEAGVLYLRDIPEAEMLASRLGPGVTLAVIGAGFIGLEVAASARQLGATVHVIEIAPQPLGRVVDPVIGRWVGALHARHGVTLHLGRAVRAIEPGGTAHRVILDDASAIDADMIVAGIGAVPNTELAEAAGLAVRDGILTDEQGRTDDPAIRAAGDCTRHFNPLLGRAIRLESWQNAQNQAIAVARCMAGIDHPHAEIPWFWSDQYDMNLQSLGIAEPGAPLSWRGDPEGADFIAFTLADGRIAAATGVNRAKEMAAVRRIMQRNVAVEPAVLADPATRLVSLAKG
ncbi:MAG TPA: FAD-dependent oxidoreductase [Acetobacteraceae bacterium]|nr:FAD-dependent oxidoreductase [Acetobacteraceae bacterium]